MIYVFLFLLFDFFCSNVELKEEDLKSLEEEMAKIVENNYPFERNVRTVEYLEKRFRNDPFKKYFIQRFKTESPELTTYTSGDFEDLCRGPHVESTGLCKRFHLTKIAPATFTDDSGNPVPVQRVYGLCFPTDEDEQQYQNLLKAMEREHTKIGRVCFFIILKMCFV